MVSRTIALFAAPAALFAAASALADPISGDIVDQILQTMPPRPSEAQPAPPPAPASAMPSPAPTPIAQAPMPPPPPPGHAPAPVAQAPMPPPRSLTAAPAAPPPPVHSAAPAPAVEPQSNGDIIDQALQVMPAQPETAVALPWRGYYFGVNAGYGTTHGGNGVSCVNTVSNDTSGCAIVGDSGFNTSGPLGGGQVGYLLPVHLGPGLPLIVGAETDLEGSGVSGSRSNPGPFPFSGFPVLCSPCSYSATQKLDWFGTLRLRIGVPIDNLLIYATGGAIYGGATVTQNLTFAGAPGYLANTSKRLAGPVVGGGVEFMLPDSPWSARFEALYYDLGNVTSVTSPQSGFAANFSETKTFGFKGAIVRLGVNMRLGDFGAF
jgi:outer membrane immunogenic protein